MKVRVEKCEETKNYIIEYNEFCLVITRELIEDGDGLLYLINKLETALIGHVINKKEHLEILSAVTNVFCKEKP